MLGTRKFLNVSTRHGPTNVFLGQEKPEGARVAPWQLPCPGQFMVCTGGRKGRAIGDDPTNVVVLYIPVLYRRNRRDVSIRTYSIYPLHKFHCTMLLRVDIAPKSGPYLPISSSPYLLFRSMGQSRRFYGALEPLEEIGRCGRDDLHNQTDDTCQSIEVFKYPRVEDRRREGEEEFLCFLCRDFPPLPWDLSLYLP